MALHAISLLTQRRLIDDIERHRGDAREFIDSGGEDRPPIQMRMHRHTSNVRRDRGRSPTRV